MLQASYIHFADNTFTGSVPQDLGRLQNLQIINMSGNRLGSTEGDHDLDFITSLVNCTKLKILVFEDNSLKASLVNSSIANLSTQINWISLGINEIHGTIPSGIENLVNLTFLSIESN